MIVTSCAHGGGGNSASHENDTPKGRLHLIRIMAGPSGGTLE